MAAAPTRPDTIPTANPRAPPGKERGNKQESTLPICERDHVSTYVLPSEKYSPAKERKEESRKCLGSVSEVSRKCLLARRELDTNSATNSITNPVALTTALYREHS